METNLKSYNVFIFDWYYQENGTTVTINKNRCDNK